ncbi:hypothetical protein QO200_08070 [Flavobacterium sp. Arc3]|jgi:hypothetical protein|uniref:hypothetical protein n=1 Tax=unclassified Flavobacterium TaxID=196869 RepID=UPI00352E8725
MIAAICTLFEGHYHYGVATLSNSLYKNGFRGTVYVGYRGSLPSWALKGKKEAIDKWKEAIIVSPIEGLKLVFLKLETNYSLTNYKPDFMLELWEGPAKNAEALYYFDPDIVVNDSWVCFEQWVQCGVGLCEDIDSPLQEFHPRRVGWRNYFKKFNIDLEYKNQTYVNGGFVGLLKKDISFLKLWNQIQVNMGAAIGGLENSIFSNESHSLMLVEMEGFTIFDKSDQDALNATIEAFDGSISYLGKEGMGFKYGHVTMFHALGSPKPWNTYHLLRAIQGRPPRILDTFYWENTKSPIFVHTKFEIFKKKISVIVGKFIGRFYKV